MYKSGYSNITKTEQEDWGSLNERPESVNARVPVALMGPASGAMSDLRVERNETRASGGDRGFQMMWHELRILRFSPEIFGRHPLGWSGISKAYSLLLSIAVLYMPETKKKQKKQRRSTSQHVDIVRMRRSYCYSAHTMRQQSERALVCRA